jgi:dipeptidyl aminopeptidase/acylaminoacyl peptidase
MSCYKKWLTLYQIAMLFCALYLLLTSKPIKAETPAELSKVIQVSVNRTTSPLISREKFLQTPQLQRVRISPNGRYLSYTIVNKKYTTLSVMDIDQGRHWNLYNTKAIDDTFWSTDSQVIFVEADDHISVVNFTEGSSPSLLTSLDEEGAIFYGIDPTQPQAIVVANKKSREEHYVVHRITLDAKKSALYEDNVPIADFTLDNQGNINFVKKVINDDQFGIFAVKQNKPSLNPILICPVTEICSLVSFHESSDELYLQGHFGSDLNGLYRFSTQTKQITKLHQDPEGRFDLDRLLINPTTKSPTMARYVNDSVSYYGVDSESEALLERIQKHIPGNIYSLLSSNNLNRLLIADLSLSKRLPDYYVYDKKVDSLINPFKDLVEKIEDDSNTVPSNAIAQTFPIHYTVSDGMQQQGYITLPNGLDPSKLPLIVVPHGGPWSRAEGSYLSIIQFMANRGYAVFQPNFRGSTGFGKNYVLSANKDFGNGRVQQDIIDGTNYTLSMGIGDKSKLGIFGHSFGGFAALGALAFTPNLFQVGIASSPPVDLAQTIQLPSQQGRNRLGVSRQEQFKHLLADINDKKALKELSNQSPNAYWKQVNKPLYIMAGSRDQRVSIQSIKDYSSRLSHAGKSVLLLVDDNEGHNFQQKLAREAYFYTLEKALHLHLGGQFQNETSNNLKRYLKKSVLIDTHQTLKNNSSASHAP